MSKYHLVIFVTGGITLSLELLASRILAPYFGVSLFIWTGILSITLVALALGYWWGGRLAMGSRSGNVAKLSFTFTLMPSISCLSILAAALVYPKLFVPLANFHLVGGSFLACSLILFVPLVTVSAMNPLLVALSAAQMGSKRQLGDAGAGWVFFISTLGSVLGVLITAFFMVPNVTNFRSLLLLAIALAVLAVVLSRSEEHIEPKQQRWLLTLALVGGLAALLLLALASKYLQKDQLLTKGRGTFRLVHEEPTFFGNIKVVDCTMHHQVGHHQVGHRQVGHQKLRLYLLDGLAQCVMHEDGQPGMSITYGMESVGRGLAPRATRILVLGLAGGILPMRFASPDVDIDVVEINPDSISIAERYFEYDISVAHHHVMDARVYARECTKKYDLIFADLFHGDATPEYLMTAEFMADLAHCLAEKGGVVFNLAGHSDVRFEAALCSYVKTVNTVWPNVLLFHQGKRGLCNLIIIASADSLESYQPAKIPIPMSLERDVQQMLVPRPLKKQQLEAAQTLTDNSNVASVQYAWFYLQTRTRALSRLPPLLLVN